CASTYSSGGARLTRRRSEGCGEIPRSRVGLVQQGARDRSFLGRIVLVGLDGMGNMQPQVAEFQTQRLPGDAQQTRSLVLTAAGMFQNQGQQESIDVAVGLRVQVASVGSQSLANEGFQLARVCFRRRHRIWRGTRGAIRLGQEGREKDGTARPEQGLLEDALKFPDVARPARGLKTLERLRR